MTVDPRALDVIVVSDLNEDLEDLTLRQYFQRLLLMLWQDPNEFNGKRPFGYSGWDTDVIVALIRGGFVEGMLDENGYIEEYDREAVNNYVSELIQQHLFG